MQYRLVSDTLCTGVLLTTGVGKRQLSWLQKEVVQVSRLQM
jgi:hypothetical protein